MGTLISEYPTTNQINLLRKYLKLKLMDDYAFRGHSQEWNDVYDLFKRTVSHRESHSALMIGPPGSGKTTLINSVLHQIGKEVNLSSDCIVVRLKGLIHHDEKSALKSITEQMHLENAVGDRVFKTFAENLEFLLKCLQNDADQHCKSLLFILEDFDMFYHIGHTQTLLYNLFEMTHSKYSMCVLGVTNCVDVMELLEKRVISRFSHRVILVCPNEATDGSQIVVESYRDMLVQMLSMPVAAVQTTATPKQTRQCTVTQVDLMEIDQDTKKNTYNLSEEVLQRCKIDCQQWSQLDASFLNDWNAHVKALAEDDKVYNSIEKFCYYTVNEQIFRNILFQLVCKLSPSKPYIQARELVTLIDETVAPEHRIKLLQSLSILEVSLVIAMKHGVEIFDGQPMNFEMVLHRYTKFANANSSTQTVPRPVIFKAFEHLQELEIIMPVQTADSIYFADETTAGRVQKEYILYTLAVPNEDIDEAVKNFKALPTEIGHWYHNSVV